MSGNDFKVGDSVVVNPNINDVDLGTDISGWQGRIVEISERNNLICIAWDSLTLKQMPGAMIDQCEVKGMGWEQYYLPADEAVLTSPRDSEDDVKNSIVLLASKHGWSFLGEEGKRIQAVLANAEDDELAAYDAWETHFKQVLTFPFEAEVSEWQDRGPLRTDEQVTVLGIEGSADPYGVLVSLRRKRQKLVFPLCDLAAVDESSSNYEPVKDYAVWYANR